MSKKLFRVRYNSGAAVDLPEAEAKRVYESDHRRHGRTVFAVAIEVWEKTGELDMKPKAVEAWAVCRPDGRAFSLQFSESDAKNVEHATSRIVHLVDAAEVERLTEERNEAMEGEMRERQRGDAAREEAKALRATFDRCNNDSSLTWGDLCAMFRAIPVAK